ncbi:hypothetical protein Y032_0255g333 [Ancylostoma ceylanicum]|nr:hypothetical protein Y032_0255g333 [Ancylostoma ceylanicum]
MGKQIGSGSTRQYMKPLEDFFSVVEKGQLFNISRKIWAPFQLNVLILFLSMVHQLHPNTMFTHLDALIEEIDSDS